MNISDSISVFWLWFGWIPGSTVLVDTAGRYLVYFFIFDPPANPGLMKHYWLFAYIGYFLAALPVVGQNQARAAIDVLLREIGSMPDDTNKVQHLVNLSYQYGRIHTDSSILYGEEAVRIAGEVQWEKGVALAKNVVATSYLSQFEAAQALTYYMEALDINKRIGNRGEEALNLGNIGNVYYQQEDFDKALGYYMSALKLQELSSNKEKMATNLGNIANVYSYHYDTSGTHTSHKILYKNKALEYYTRAYTLYNELGNFSGMARNLGNCGNIYKWDEDKSMALYYYEKALDMYENIGSDFGRAAMMVNLSGLYSDVASDTTGKLKIKAMTARLHKARLIEKVIGYSTTGIQLARSIGFLEAVHEGLGILAEACILKKDYKQALEYQRQYIQISESIYQKQNAERISRLEARNKVEQQDKEIQIRKLKDARRRIANFFMAIGILFLLVLIIFIAKERKRTEKILLNILPASIAKRLKRKEYPIADQFTAASVIFIDMAGFTSYTMRKEPKDMVNILNDIFTRFDAIAEKHGLEKIKTIGDCYMAAAGLPEIRSDHTIAAADMALEIKECMQGFQAQDGTPIHFRIGLDCGPVVAGVIGRRKFIYDLWGDAVNTASRMESTGVIDEIHCTDNFRVALQDIAGEERYLFVAREPIDIKGKGRMQTWLLKSGVMSQVIS